MADIGEVEIVLSDKKEMLRPTLRAARMVNSMGGFQEAFRKLLAFDMTAYVTIVAAGLGKRPDEVEEAVYKRGLSHLADPLAVFVGNLANGGKPLSASEEQPAGEA